MLVYGFYICLIIVEYCRAIVSPSRNTNILLACWQSAEVGKESLARVAEAEP